MTKIYLAIAIFTLFSAAPAFAGEPVSGEAESFAQEYAHLRVLLGKVQNRESAVTYKSQIAEELDRLKASQINGGQAFDVLSAEEQQVFIKKFQNNQYHCSNVTQVMEERSRILLNPEINEVLGVLLMEIP